MTETDVIQMLSAAGNTVAELPRIQEQIERLDALRQKTTLFYSLVSGGGGNNSRIENITARILELKEMWLAKVDEYLKQYKRLEGAVRLVERQNPKAANILRLRYMYGGTWKVIASADHYEQRQVFRLHKQGIKILMNEPDFENLWPEIKRCQ